MNNILRRHYRLWGNVHFKTGCWCRDMERKVDVPLHATVNDIQRLVHLELCTVNASRPLGERLPDAIMDELDIQLGIFEGSRRVTSRFSMAGPSSYVSGARRFSNFVSQLYQRGGLPRLFAFV